MELFLLVLTALFSVMNPLGTVPIFVSLTSEHSQKQKNLTALWTSVNVLIILIISYFAGSYLLSFFGIRLEALKIAGGLIITASGFALLTGNFTRHKGMKRKAKVDAYTRSEISLTPLAIPMLAGPGTISLLISYHQEYPNFTEKLSILAAILFAAFGIYAVLMSSKLIVRALGASGINALSRIIGFIVIAIGIEYIISAAETLLTIFK